MESELLLGDCLEKMKELQNNSVDLVVTSPPYDNLRTYNGTIKWNEEIWEKIIVELFRVVKNGGIVVWVVGDATRGGSETGTSFKQTLWAMECGFNLHDTMIWYKTNPMPHIKQSVYTQAFEYMFVWGKGKPRTANPLHVPSKYAGKILKTHTTNPESIRKPNRTRATKNKKIDHNVWSIVVAGKNFGHPAIFPLEIAERHILSWSNVGDIILDPFMGSGTVGVACQKLKRNFIGIEISKEYMKIAEARIEHARKEQDAKLL